MRVLIAGHTGLPFGGIATYCESLLNSSLSKHVDVFFAETSHGSHNVSARGGWGLHNAVSAFQNILHFLLVFLQVRPRVVHIMTAQMPSMLKHGIMLIFARSLGARVILHIHCGVSAMFPDEDSFQTLFTKFVLRQADSIIVLSQEWLNFKNRMGNTPVYYLANGIHLAPYLALSRISPMPKPEPIRILYLGHLGASKGTFDLIEAAHLLSDEKFVIELVGEPFNIEAKIIMKEKIDKYSLHHAIRISSPEFGKEKLLRFVNADIFILPSHSEGMPISIIESMAAGLPAIATRVGAIPDMIEHNKTGLLVLPGHPELLANAIRILIQSSETRLQMGIYARDAAQAKYNIELIVPKLVELYHLAGSLV